MKFRTVEGKEYVKIDVMLFTSLHPSDMEFISESLNWPDFDVWSSGDGYGFFLEPEYDTAVTKPTFVKLNQGK